MECEPSDLLKLAELLKPPSVEDQRNPEIENNVEKKPFPYEQIPRKAPKNIEEFEQLNEDRVSFENSKKQPSYDMIYRQAVTAEDMFLQMGPKTPSSASCEDIVLTIDLPGETFSALNLNLTETKVSIDGFLYNLNLDLPHPIDPDKSKAKWNADDEKLILTLRLRREYDFINF